ncbi:hypothetical protein L208DRAFT_1365677 [Tricholoma matsutake]|nr:hypothetical protein L208DRAFT_1365677 [Tricholoma matsutake 945]
MPNLPPADRSEAAQLGLNALSAYRVCLAFQQQVTEKPLITHARILGYLILHAPTENARHEIVKAIHSCNNDFNVLSKLGQSFIDYYIRPFKKFKGRTPAPSDHPSRPSFDKDKKDLQGTIREAPKSHVDAKEQALERDGLRCVVTGMFDFAASRSISDQQVIAAGGAVNTECAHIVPDSTYFDVSNTPTSSSVKKEYSASVLAVLKRFGYDVESLNGPKVHSLYNVMTMQHDVHDWFDRLDMWFEETNVANCYNVKTTSNRLQVPRQVTFTSSDPTKYPELPSPRLLALHAACAKVAHLSGAGEHIDSLDRDMDHLGVLAFDGSSSTVLNHALWNKATHSIGVMG